MNVQQHIKDLMEERNWTEYRLAKESGIPHSTVANIFKRNNVPTLPTLEAMCTAFGLTLAQFFSEGTSVELTEEQMELFKKWNMLTPEQKQVLLKLIDVML